MAAIFDFQISELHSSLIIFGLFLLCAEEIIMSDYDEQNCFTHDCVKHVNQQLV
jgi:hypothetical protein